MRKLRMALCKGEELRFLSHLDYVQAVERTIRRAGLEMAYSEGFNPHMKISFSSALALGVTASVEYMDMEVVETTPVAEIVARLRQAAPKGMEILDGKEIEPKCKKMMAICNFARYSVTGAVTATADWEALLAPFNEAATIMYEKVTPKKTREIDVKHFVKEPLRADYDDAKKQVTLHMGIGIYPEGTIKPSEVWILGRDRYGWPVTEAYSVHREAILVEDAEGLHTPLEKID